VQNFVQIYLLVALGQMGQNITIFFSLYILFNSDTVICREVIILEKMGIAFYRLRRGVSLLMTVLGRVGPRHRPMNTMMQSQMLL